MGERRADESSERATNGAGDAPPRVKVGEYLAQQRRLRGISVDELCEITKIPRRNLERLESGAFDEQQDGFARGFVRTVALALGLDPDEAVMRLMREPDPDAEPAGSGTRALLLRWGLVAALLLLAIALFELGIAWLATESPPPEPELTYRRDAVSDLARERSEAEAPPDGPAPPSPPPSP